MENMYWKSQKFLSVRKNGNHDWALYNFLGKHLTNFFSDLNKSFKWEKVE